MVRLAEARGVPTADLLQQAGLTRAFLEDPDSRIPAPTVLALWDALRGRTGDPALQLSAPSILPFGAYRVIDYIVAASETLGEGVERFARFFGLIAQSVSLHVDHDDGEYRLSLAGAGGASVPPVYVDYVFAALVSRIRMRIRPGLQVHRVQFRRPAPENIAPYQEVFRAPVRFGAPSDTLCFSAREWNSPTDSADAALARLLEEHARVLAARTTGEAAPFCMEVQKVISAAPDRGGSAADVARALNVSVRTMQRRLDASGTTFRELSNSVRGQLAEGYLADPRVSIAEVAFLLGFSDQSSFNRAFRRWTGDSPGRWRRRG